MTTFWSFSPQLVHTALRYANSIVISRLKHTKLCVQYELKQSLHFRRTCEFLRELWSERGTEWEVEVPKFGLFDTLKNKRAWRNHRRRIRPDRVLQVILIVIMSTSASTPTTKIANKPEASHVVWAVVGGTLVSTSKESSFQDRSQTWRVVAGRRKPPSLSDTPSEFLRNFLAHCQTEGTCTVCGSPCFQAGIFPVWTTRGQGRTPGHSGCRQSVCPHSYQVWSWFQRASFLEYKSSSGTWQPGTCASPPLHRLRGTP